MERICEAERMLIGGELVESVTGEWITSINPATEEPIGRVPAGSSEDVDRAVQAAEKAARLGGIDTDGTGRGHESLRRRYSGPCGRDSKN
ncbi:hypothetical protein HSBAA_48460 [Vreelandella sulfidaeris]|uniref:Aldehyde dehydrogenase domain-containing protein n=1 Tax=Vreelandella sulfidaeris TaxID=115553 RepID=A0A455UBE0_9GAMM|nr:hypothetical protein HSBAA_48460 [Halomonas sulfidaeris]